MTAEFLDLTPLAILRPEKTRWMHDGTAPDVLATLKSHTLHQFLKRADEVLEKEAIVVENVELTADSFSEWLSHYYEFVDSKGYDRLATPAWFQQKPLENKRVYAFIFRRQGKICGSSIYTIQENKRVYAAYKTNDDALFDFKKQNSLGALIDYYVLRELRSQGFTWISMGTMRNAFGVINPVGNLYYKLRMGYFPCLIPSEKLLSQVPLSPTGEVAFLGMQNNCLTLFLYPSETYTHGELMRFNSATLPVLPLPAVKTLG